MIEKEYNIRLTAEFTGTAIGDNRQEAVEDMDLLDFIDEATHSGNFQVVEIKSKIGMKDVLPKIKRYFNRA
ncbi:TPA: hypothetical protein HA278_07210 [Candidatus Woesearchaeota archaeon]|nr:hypothetical protein [Candidatus Woesearchaeota archaeon]|tara:strand:- start:1064 stop:1276 length:213 start_codon:yes stop_codon:yes gene_type:complete